MQTSTERFCAIDARIIHTSRPCREHILIEMAVSGFGSSQPGQFLQLRCADESVGERDAIEWCPGERIALSNPDFFSRNAYLRRPFSIADRCDPIDGTTHLVVISRNIGVGTHWLDHLRPGDALNISGPFGRPFHVPDADVPILLVGGGVGIPPLLYLARHLAELKRRRTTLIFGATSRDLFPVPLSSEPDVSGSAKICIRTPGAAQHPAIVTTDDGTLGLKGRVTSGLDAWRTANPSASNVMICACGPEPMLHAVSRFTRIHGFTCQLCIERTMGCAMGTCLSCIVRVPDPNRAAGWRWALSCSEGPVFDGERLLDFAD